MDKSENISVSILLGLTLVIAAGCHKEAQYQVAPGIPCFQKSTDKARSLFGEAEIEKLLNQIRDNCEMLSMSDQGTGDQRDHYIILNRLDFNYGMLRASDCKAAAEIRKQRNEMDAKSQYKYSAMQDWKLGAAFRTELSARGKVKDPNDAPDPPPAVVPPPLSPEEQALASRRNGLSGQMFHFENHFAVFNWNVPQVGFFEIPAGMVLYGERPEALVPMPVDRTKYGSAATYSLCATENVSASGECSKIIYPEPTAAIRSEVLQILPAPGNTNESKYLLISTERYRNGRNTAHQPVDKPFYGIYDLAGNETYRLPPIEVSSGSYVFAMGINPQEPAAIFGIGGLIDVCGAEEDYDLPAYVKEVLLWTPSKPLKKIDTRTRTPEVEELMKRFGIKDHWFYFFTWPSYEQRHGC